LIAALFIAAILRRPKLTILTVAALLAMLIQAVIGKIVVDTAPVLITIHMIVVLPL
jgi:cytochrome c oxidase assembly protein subunit 15